MTPMAVLNIRLMFEANAKYIFEEAENRLHAQKAVLVKTMGGASHGE